MSEQLQAYIHKTKEQWNAQLSTVERLPLWKEKDVPFWDDTYEQSTPALFPFLAKGGGKKARSFSVLAVVISGRSPMKPFRKYNG